ncbi:LysR substrate-binding domain-containing protein [Scandinavium sp. V105_16]|uniref:LysR substrate-binding domain-containing protein n=1 Tax=Scandinavium lactucae TaxID=3095028 RepID=A0AAJ2SCE1_9ENTR|nr:MULTISPECIES: LysR substrate-binding domain-containing protein [unclassified Scandinavium]MDX6022199.1 LysR substrate-binding domain-containing protein [Scandinavium sp. V105_16]MDX6033959.1 LysR substrate-binding domain-containing protein [Scandinavium sp. V105_12]
MNVKVPATLDLDALRSFVLGIDSGSFASAAHQLARSTSAVSAQLKKLELQCHAELVVKEGRHLRLTPQGEIVMSYARRLLALNDEVHRALHGELLKGEVRIGMQEDFGESLMPGILGKFSRLHPQLRMSARIDRNQPLINALAADSLDMALMWQSADTPNRGDVFMHCSLEWIYHPDLNLSMLLDEQKPLPLVMFDSPCVMRSRAIDCLDKAGIPWQINFVSHSLSGIWAAVQAGLGLTLRTYFGRPDNLLTADDLLPSPGKLGITLVQNAPESEGCPAQEILATLMKDAVLGRHEYAK